MFLGLAYPGDWHEAMCIAEGDIGRREVGSIQGISNKGWREHPDE